jgi:hypothetical protein
MGGLVPVQRLGGGGLFPLRKIIGIEDAGAESIVKRHNAPLRPPDAQPVPTSQRFATWYFKSLPIC